MTDLKDHRRFYAQVEVKLRYSDVVWAATEAEATGRLRAAVPEIFGDVSPEVVDVVIRSVKQEPEAEDLVQ